VIEDDLCVDLDEVGVVFVVVLVELVFEMFVWYVGELCMILYEFEVNFGVIEWFGVVWVYVYFVGLFVFELLFVGEFVEVLTFVEDAGFCFWC